MYWYFLSNVSHQNVDALFFHETLANTRCESIFCSQKVGRSLQAGSIGRSLFKLCSVAIQLRFLWLRVWPHIFYAFGSIFSRHPSYLLFFCPLRLLYEYYFWQLLLSFVTACLSFIPSSEPHILTTCQTLPLHSYPFWYWIADYWTHLLFDIYVDFFLFYPTSWILYFSFLPECLQWTILFWLVDLILNRWDAHLLCTYLSHYINKMTWRSSSQLPFVTSEQVL